MSILTPPPSAVNKILFSEEQNLITILYGSEFIALKKDTIVGFHISMTNISNQYIKFYTRDDTIVFPLIDDRETVRQILESLKKVLLTPPPLHQNVSINF
jgi:hypothetical protein